METALGNLKAYEWLVFTSPAGVEVFGNQMRTLGWDGRNLAGIRLAALGPGTARALSILGLRTDFMPAVYDAAHLGQELPARGRVLILRAAQGSPALTETLARRTIAYDDIAVYRTVQMCIRDRDYRDGTYARAGGVVDPLPADAPFFVKDYYDYYKTERGYTERSLNSNDGWNVTSSLSFLNMPILRYSHEIRSAVLMIHGEKAHSCYFSRDAYADLVRDNPYADNKELLIIPDAVHTDLYDRCLLYTSRCV